jgi:hypothetical protein
MSRSVVRRPARLVALVVATGAALLAAPAAGAQPLAAPAGVNAGALPASELLLAGSVAWTYTPGASVALAGIHTRFLDTGPAADRVVWIELLDASRTTRLRTASFGTAAARGRLGGALFDTPFTLEAGTTYVIGFRGTGPLDEASIDSYLGANFTDAPGATRLDGLWYDMDGSGRYDSWLAAADAGPEVQPILHFVEAPATTVTPEPGTWLLVGSGLLALGGVRARRRPSAGGGAG